MSIIMITLDALYVIPEDLEIFLKDGIVLEGEAVLNKRTDDYSAIDLLEQAAERVNECCRKPQIKWVDDDITRNTVSLMICYPDLPSQVLEDRFERQPLEVDYHILDENR